MFDHRIVGFYLIHERKIVWHLRTMKHAKRIFERTTKGGINDTERELFKTVDKDRKIVKTGIERIKIHCIVLIVAKSILRVCNFTTKIKKKRVLLSAILLGEVLLVSARYSKRSKNVRSFVVTVMPNVIGEKHMTSIVGRKY